jgi:ATP-binding cassette subfamily B protein
MIEAAQAANAHDFIMGFPQQYDTVVGERGTKLSGGQRQRISIARAILKDPRILLLDEATSSVDTRTEKQIERGMDRLMKNRTTFVIAHRLSTVRNSNKIIVLEHGEIVEQGTHEELLKMRGRYYQLYTGATELD